MTRLTVVVLLPVSTLPLASSTAMVTEGEMDEPAAVFVGCWTKASFVAVPGVTLKADDVAAVNDRRARRRQRVARSCLVDRETCEGGDAGVHRDRSAAGEGSPAGVGADDQADRGRVVARLDVAIGASTATVTPGVR